MVDWGEDQGLVYWWLCTLALAFPDIAWWVHEPCRHSGRHGGYGLDRCLRVPGLPAAEANSEPRCGTGPWDDQPASWWHTSSTGPLPPWEGQHLSLLEQILILAHKASPQPPTWTYQKLYPPSWCSTQHCFWPRNWFHSQRSVSLGPRFTMFPPFWSS